MMPELEALTKTPYMMRHATTWHSHETLQVGYLIRGGLVMEFGPDEYPIEPHTFTLIARGHIHRIAAEEGSGQFVGRVRMDPAPRFFSSEAVAVADFDWIEGNTLLVPNATQLGEWLEELIQAWNSGAPVDAVICQGLLLRLLAALPRWPGTRIANQTAEPTGSWTDQMRFEEAVRAIESRYRDFTLKASDVAEACSMSVSSLYKLFARHVGVTPKHFIQKYRCDRARERISHSLTPLSQIAEEVGYPDLYAFSRVFKRITGRPPSTCRDSHRPRE